MIFHIFLNKYSKHGTKTEKSKIYLIMRNSIIIWNFLNHLLLIFGSFNVFFLYIQNWIHMHINLRMKIFLEIFLEMLKIYLSFDSKYWKFIEVLILNLMKYEEVFYTWFFSNTISLYTVIFYNAVEK